jgi:serine/threonine protein kinase/predicted Zn-dependent protease
MRLMRRYEEAWQEAHRAGSRLDPEEFLADLAPSEGGAGSRLAILRADLALRWESGDHTGAQWYLETFPELGEDTLVALVYEEFCLREEDGEEPDPADFLVRYSCLAASLRRVLDIHRLIGSGTASSSTLFPQSSISVAPAAAGAAAQGSLPEAGQTIAGFYLVEELGRGAFARVFLARERQLADRSVALKVTRKGSREPQALARLQHTNIVPVHSHRVDPATGLHLLCMPYFGRITLARVLAEVRQDEKVLTGASLIEALDRLEDAADPPGAKRSPCRVALVSRTYAQAVAWWAARLAEALEHAHARGILHRDIKPSNVLIMDDGMPMLLDFNLARESVLSSGDDSAGAGDVTLGGTVDYMAPEHLEALAEGVSDGVDGRSDVYGLGVLIYEAVGGKKPFLPPRRGRSVFDCLLKAAHERRKDPAVLFQDNATIPPPLEAVIRRCLEPEPKERYQLAAHLAADLRAVADDLPLAHAREPVLSRIGRRVRRNRRRLAMAAIILLAGAAMLGVYVNHQIERHDLFNDVDRLCGEANGAMIRYDFEGAQIWLDAADQRLKRGEQGTLRNRLKWETLWGFGGKLRRKLELLWTDPPMEDLEGKIQLKSQMVRLIVKTRGEAKQLLDSSEALRFRLIGLGEHLPGAVEELKGLLQPFYVLETKDGEVTPKYIWDLLDKEQQARLRHEVNELLFLWMVGVENALDEVEHSHEKTRPKLDPKALENALFVCDRALVFAEPKEPWLALKSLLQEHRAWPPGGEAKPAAATPKSGQPHLLLRGEPIHCDNEDSASACFEWGLLCSSHGNKDRAIEWLEQAVRLEWSNYWYQFYLAFLKDQEGLLDDALDHYSAAVARQPESPWVRFNLARIYRAKGKWSWALDDLRQAKEGMGDRPESLQVALELGVLHGALGNFKQAAIEYRKIIAEAPGSEYARAARLNLANIDAESGRELRASIAYEGLLKQDSNDHAARLSRAYLSLRQGQPAQSLCDLEFLLLHSDTTSLKRAELLSARAIALLLLNRRSEAVSEAARARRLRPCPAGERLWQRTLLADGRYDELDLDRPDEVLLLPVGGAWLTADLRTAARELAQRTTRSDAASFRRTLSLAAILSALGEHPEALSATDRALAMTAFSPEARLIRARILHQAGDRKRAMAEVDLGLQLQPAQPGLLELRGVLLTEDGRPEEGLICLDQAITRSPHHFAHLHRAATLMALGRIEDAVYEWSVALKRDPELPQAYLGRAQCYIRLLSWDRALADLEQASAWAHGDLRLQAGIILAYAKCLPERREHLGRWLLLLERTARQGWDLLRRTSVPSGFFGDHIR